VLHPVRESLAGLHRLGSKPADHAPSLSPL
jgi:hypothetical protein